MEHTALIYTMVLVSAADSEMADAELYTIGGIVRTLPAFKGFDQDLLPRIAEDCAEMLSQENGLDAVIELIRDSLPSRLRETAYALACDIAATDCTVGQEIERLVAAAIARGARAHYQTID